jgi:type VI protein secretion system component VasK
VNFLNAAVEGRKLFFPANAIEPVLHLNIQMLPDSTAKSLAWTIDGQRQTIRAGGEAIPLVWRYRQSRTLRVEADYGGGPMGALEFSGPWAVFHWLRSADDRSSASPLTWVRRTGAGPGSQETLNGKPMTYRLALRLLDGGPFRWGDLDYGGCVLPAVAR